MAGFLDVEIGDKVITNKDKIGQVIRITPTGQIVVSFGSVQGRYKRDGWSLGGDVWSKTKIRKATKEDFERIQEKKVLAACGVLFDKYRNQLTLEQALAIVEILKKEEEK